MAQEHKYWINNHNTNIVIINSGEMSHRLSNSPRHANYQPVEQNSRNATPHNRTFLELPSLNDSEEKTHKTPGDVSPGASFDVFTRSESFQPGSKFFSDSIIKRRTTGNSKGEVEQRRGEVQHRRKREASLMLTYNKSDTVLEEEDPAPETEPFSIHSEDENMRHLKSEGMTINAPTLGFIPRNGMDKPVSTINVEDDYKFNLDERSASRLFDSLKKLPSNVSNIKGRNPRRSLSSPESIAELQKKLHIPLSDSRHNISYSKNNISMDDDTSKRPSMIIKSEKSNFFDRIRNLTGRKSSTTLTNQQMHLIDDKTVSQSDLKTVSNNQRGNEHDKGGDNASGPSSKPENKLVNLILKHAGSGSISKEADVFNKIMTRLQPAKLKELQTIKNQRWSNFWKKFKTSLKSSLFFMARLQLPDDPFILFWKILACFLAILNCFTVPFLLSFYFSEQETVIALIINLFFAADILINFRTAYYNKGQLITERKKILKHNLNIYLLLDIVSVFSGMIYIYVNINNLKYLTLFTMVRSIKVKHIITSVEDHYQWGREFSGFFRLLQLIVTVLILAHVSGCFFHMIAINELDTQPDSWLVLYASPNDPVLGRYVVSLYWAFTTMITVGYGDITPSTTNERIYTVFIMVVACGVFSYFINIIGVIIADINGNRAVSRQKIRQMTNYMKRKHLSRGVQVRVRKYLQYILEDEMAHRREEEGVLEMLSIPLRHEVLTEINVKALLDCRILCFSFTRKFLNIMARDLKEKSFSPEEVIFKENDFSDHSIYFVSAGKVHIYYSRCNKIIRTLNKGDFFGELSFFSKTPRSAGAKSNNFSCAYYLTRERFLEVIRNFPNDKEQFSYIQDRIALENNIDFLHLKCYSCDEDNHIASQCPKIHFFVEDKDQILADFRMETENFQKAFKRKNRPRFKPYEHLEILTNDAIRVRSAIGNLDAAMQQAQEAESLVNFYTDTFNEILERKVYLPYYQKVGLVSASEQAIDSIQSMENLNTLLLPRNPDNMQPSQSHQQISRDGFQGTLMSYDASSNGSPMHHRGSIQIIHAPGNQAGSQVHNPPPKNFAFDIVQNFEIYYPHGNISIISKKHNVAVRQRMVENHFERKMGRKINKNIIRSVNILSRGSLYGSSLKKSSDSLLSTPVPPKHNRKESDAPSSFKNSSFYSSHLAGSSHQLQQNSMESNAVNETGVKPSIFKDQFASAKRDSSFFLNPERLNESSLLSTSSVFQHGAEAGEVMNSKRRPSRFGLMNSTNSKMLASSQLLYPDSRRGSSNTNILGLPSVTQTSFITDQNLDIVPATTGLPPDNEQGPNISNNNLVQFWRDKQMSRLSVASGGSDRGRGNESFTSPRFRKSSEGDPRNFNDKNNSDSYGDNDNTSQITFNNHNTTNPINQTQKYSEDLTSPITLISSKKAIETHLRRALKFVKEVNSPYEPDYGSSYRHRRVSKKFKYRRLRSLGEQNKLERIVKQHGYYTVLKSIIYAIRPDFRLTRDALRAEKSDDEA